MLGGMPSPNENPSGSTQKSDVKPPFITGTATVIAAVIAATAAIIVGLINLHKPPQEKTVDPGGANVSQNFSGSNNQSTVHVGDQILAASNAVQTHVQNDKGVQQGNQGAVGGNLTQTFNNNPTTRIDSVQSVTVEGGSNNKTVGINNGTVNF